jgi:CheY-like chemotaxis protein
MHAEDAETAIEMAETARPHLIMIDLDSRGINGEELMREITKHPILAPIPSISLSYSNSPREQKEAAQVACDEAFFKPFDLNRVIPIIEGLMAIPNRTDRKFAQIKYNPKPFNFFVPAFPGAQVLIIDDSQINREMLSAWLHAVGYKSLMADGGAEGLRLLKQYPVDVVLLDVVMPEMSGLECLRQIRLHRSQAELPVIMATSRDGSREMLEAFELGANDYLTKPLDLNSCMARIDNHLRMVSITTGMLEPPIIETDLPPGSEGVSIEVPIAVQSYPTLPLVDPQSDPYAPLSHSVPLNRYKICQVLSKVPRYSKYSIQDIEETEPSNYILKHLDLRSSNPRVQQIIHDLFLAEIQTFREFPFNGPVAKLLKSGHKDQQYFLIEECIKGQSLADEIKKQRALIMRKVLHTTIDLLEILVALHRHGIVHQTLQPSSFVRRSDGRLVLNDVGIFIRLNINLEKLINPRESYGNNFNDYAERSQYFGRVDPRNDIYSIGMILLELLTRVDPQSWPVDSVSFQVYWEHKISVGSGLAKIINKMIAAQADDRYSTAIEALEDVYNLPMVAMLREHGRNLI